MHVRHGQVEQRTSAQTEHLHEFTMDAREEESQEHGSCSSCSLIFDRAAPLIPQSGIPPIAAVSKRLRVSPAGQSSRENPARFPTGSDSSRNIVGHAGQ
jgi:hypothetical protein